MQTGIWLTSSAYKIVTGTNIWQEVNDCDRSLVLIEMVQAVSHRQTTWDMVIGQVTTSRW